jgi:hypothetical protein
VASSGKVRISPISPTAANWVGPEATARRPKALVSASGIQSIPSIEDKSRPPEPAATYLRPFQATALKALPVLESLCVHTNPSGEVKMMPADPTATKRSPHVIDLK